MSGNTNVDPEELTTFAGGLRGRSADVAAAADDIGGIDMGVGTFGAFNEWFTRNVRDNGGNSVTKLRDLVAALATDADTLDTNAADFRGNEDDQADTFRKMTTDG